MHRPFAAACDRNRDPILDVLRARFGDRRHVLEIGSGTGQHAVYFAQHLPHLVWQTSERETQLDGIRQWLDAAALANTPAPLALDVTGPWPDGPFDAVFSANTLHIMGWPEVCAMFARLPSVTAADACLMIYGPFNRDGCFTSNSNAAFDAMLKARDPAMGIRDAGAVDALAARAGFLLADDVSMPANNRCRVWRRTNDDT